MFIVKNNAGYYRRVETPKELCFYFRKKDGVKLSQEEAENLKSGSVLYLRRKDTRFFYLPVYDERGELIREEVHDAKWIHYEPVTVTILEEG